MAKLRITFEEKTISRVVNGNTENAQATYVDVVYVNDNMLDKVTALIFVPSLGLKSLTLWEDAGYNSIGNWTQQQAIDRILELI